MLPDAPHPGSDASAWEWLSWINPNYAKYLTPDAVEKLKDVPVHNTKIWSDVIADMFGRGSNRAFHEPGSFLEPEHIYLPLDTLEQYQLGHKGVDPIEHETLHALQNILDVDADQYWSDMTREQKDQLIDEWYGSVPWHPGEEAFVYWMDMADWQPWLLSPEHKAYYEGIYNPAFLSFPWGEVPGPPGKGPNWPPTQVPPPPQMGAKAAQLKPIETNIPGISPETYPSIKSSKSPRKYGKKYMR